MRNFVKHLIILFIALTIFLADRLHLTLRTAQFRLLVTLGVIFTMFILSFAYIVEKLVVLIPTLIP